MRNTIKDANLADKLSAEDKEAIEKAVDKVVEWLDHNQVRGFIINAVSGGQSSGWALACLDGVGWMRKLQAQCQPASQPASSFLSTLPARP